MSTRRGSASLFASPVLVGAVTTLVVIVAVFLAYNANNGLPFVPTRELKIEFPSGQELVKGDEVREGGFRIGVVTQMSPKVLSDGSVGAIATLKVDSSAGAFPADSTAVIRPRSALGLEYIDLSRGTSSRVIPDGGTLTIGQARQDVELDQVYGIFDQRTRQAVATNLKEFGDAFAARGGDLNDTISYLPRTLGLLTPVANNLSAANTDLKDFFPALERTAGAVAPLAKPFADTFTTQANTFAAIARNPADLRATISKSPSTEAVSTESLKVQIPLLKDSAALSADLDTAASELRKALPTLNSALRIGIPVTKRSSTLYGNLQGALESLLSLAQAPTTNASLRGLTATIDTLQPTVRFVGPYVTVCNYWNTFWNFLGEHISADTPQGTDERAIVAFPTNQNDSYGNVGSPFPANGDYGPYPPQNGPPVFFHGAPYPHAVDPAGNADCLDGQTGYIHRAFQYGPKNINIDIDPKAPDWLGHPQGPTYSQYARGGGGVGAGPTHVPAGETFTSTAGGIAAQVPFRATAANP